MPEDAGSLSRMVLSRTLWFVLAFPAIGLALQAVLRARGLGGRSPASPEPGRNLETLARRAGLATLALCLAAVAAHAALLARAPDPAMLWEHLLQGPRLGSLLTDVDLRFDAVGAGACGVAALVAFVAAVRSTEARQMAWLHGALLGALVVFTADDLLLLLAGATVAAASLAALDSGSPAPPEPGRPPEGRRGTGACAAAMVRGAAGVSAMLVGLGALEAAAGETASGPAFVVEHVPRSGGDACLTMALPSGASVFLDEGRVPFARAPFAERTVPAGTHVLRVRTGRSPEDQTLGPLVLPAGEEVRLLPARTTLSLRATEELRAMRGTSAALAAAWDASALQAMLMAWLFAAVAWTAWPSPAATPAHAVACATGLLTGPFLLVRAAQAFPSPGSAQSILLASGGLTFAAALWRSLGFAGVRRWLAFAAAGPAGMTMIALATGGARGAAGVMLGCALLGAAMHLWAAMRGVSPDTEGRSPASPEPGQIPEDSVLLVLPARGGELVASMDHWVVGAAVGAAAYAARAAAWAIAWQDHHALSRPVDAAARRLSRAADAVEPLAGISPGRLAWWLLGLAGALALARGLWPGGS